jgi:hypothetical protein
MIVILGKVTNHSLYSPKLGEWTARVGEPVSKVSGIPEGIPNSPLIESTGKNAKSP